MKLINISRRGGVKFKTVKHFLVILLFLSIVLSGCLGSEKKNDNQYIGDSSDVAKEMVLAFENLKRASKLEEESYQEERKDNYEKAIKLTKEATKWNEEALNHFLYASNKTVDPLANEFIDYYLEATKNYIKADEAMINKFEFKIKGDFESAKKASEEAREFYRNGGKLQIKAKELSVKI
ncbi:hypothetical protein BMS3Abin16_00291 [archaeon BMS3Abin16]|nr:hypothetical protein BMS3Abin16_00291 [archaeon BMS3Abin16]